MKWYDKAVFYHIYPLGLCGCKKENNGEKEQHFDKLTQWSDHAQNLDLRQYISDLCLSQRDMDMRQGTINR